MRNQFFRKIILLLLISGSVSAQKFQPDIDGYVDNPKFLKIIKNKGYSLVEKYFIWDKTPQEKFIAEVVFKGKIEYIDCKGNLFRFPKTEHNDEGENIETLQTQERFSDPRMQNIKSEEDNIVINKTNNGKFSIKRKTPSIPQSPVFEDTLYDQIDPLNNHLIMVSVGEFGNRKSGLINKSTGEKVTGLIYKDIYKGYTDKDPLLFSIENDWHKHWGYLDSLGREIISAKYGAAGSFRNSIAPVEFRRKWGIIDVKENFIIEPKYESIMPCYGKDLFAAKEKGKFGCINHAGKVIVDFLYDNLSFFDGPDTNSLIRFYNSKSGLFGLLGADGRILLEDKYKEITPEKNGFLLRQKNLYGFATKSGKVVIPVVYEWVNTKRTTGNLIQVMNAEGKYVYADFYGNTYPLGLLIPDLQ